MYPQQQQRRADLLRVDAGPEDARHRADTVYSAQAEHGTRLQVAFEYVNFENDAVGVIGRVPIVIVGQRHEFHINNGGGGCGG